MKPITSLILTLTLCCSAVSLSSASLINELRALRADLLEDNQVVERAQKEYAARLETNGKWVETLQADSMRHETALRSFLAEDFNPSLEPPVIFNRGALDLILSKGELETADAELAAMLRSYRTLLNRYEHYKVRNFDLVISLLNSLLLETPIQGGAITSGPLVAKIWDEVDFDEVALKLSNFIMMHRAVALSMKVFYNEFEARLPTLLSGIEKHL